MPAIMPDHVPPWKTFWTHSSTTVVTMEHMPHDAYSDNTWRGADANAASATRPGCDRRCAARPAPHARAADEFRAHSRGSEPPLGLECRQTACFVGGPRAFFQQLDRDGP